MKEFYFYALIWILNSNAFLYSNDSAPNACYVQQIASGLPTLEWVLDGNPSDYSTPSGGYYGIVNNISNCSGLSKKNTDIL